jgi:short-subunit dehydrogenase
LSSQYPWKRVWITGASTGIGNELAVLLAHSGVHVTAIARSGDLLTAMGQTHTTITPLVLDVSDRAAVATAFKDHIARDGVPDLIVLNAAIWQPMGAMDFDAGKSAQSMTVNYTGTANCIEAIVPSFIARGNGHLALVASVAGFRGLPKSAAYSPTKAAMICLAECLDADLARYGIKTTIINPGFVETPMTAVNKFPMPFIIKADDAARRIADGLAKGKYEITFPWQLASFMKLARLAPNFAFRWYVRKFILRDTQ